MGFKGWIKTWGALLVAVIALTLSGYAIYVDNVHYQEVTKPHTQHDEIYNRLVMLDGKIERAEQSINAVQDLGQNISEPQKNLRKAKELRDQAELAWDTGRYIEADAIIREAYDVLQKIPPPPPPKPINWPVLGGVIGGVIVLVLLILWLVVFRRRGSEQ